MSDASLPERSPEVIAGKIPSTNGFKLWFAASPASITFRNIFFFATSPNTAFLLFSTIFIPPFICFFTQGLSKKLLKHFLIFSLDEKPPTPIFALVFDYGKI